MSIWQFQRTLTGRLLLWAVVSIGAGTWMLRMNKFWRGMGSQFISWGAINAMLALFGGASSSHRMRTEPDALDPDYMDKETINLSRLLWLNAGLDILYMLGGLGLSGSRSYTTRGMGIGVILQGVFLFFFDVLHAVLIPPTKNAWRFWDFSQGEAKNQRKVVSDLE